MTFIAAYPGICAECGGEFDQGTEIQYDGTGKLVHATCPVVDLRLARPVCPECRLEMPASGVCC